MRKPRERTQFAQSPRARYVWGWDQVLMTRFLAPVSCMTSNTSKIVRLLLVKTEPLTRELHFVFNHIKWIIKRDILPCVSVGNLCEWSEELLHTQGRVWVFGSVTACQNPVSPQKCPAHWEHCLPGAPMVGRLWTEVPTKQNSWQSQAAGQTAFVQEGCLPLGIMSDF